MTIGLDTPLTRSDGVLFAPAGPDECLMMNLETGRYHGVGAVGARVWELLETPKTIAQLCAQICEEFDVDEQTCQADVLKFTNDLIENDIVHQAAG